MKNNNVNSIRPSYEVVQYNTDSGPVSMDIKTVKDILAVGTNVTDSEVIQFMQLCRYRKLNPFIKQAYLVKFKDKADIIVGIDVFTQRLTNHPLCEGWECGVIVLNEKGEIIRRPGTFFLDEEKLVGAYCDIRKKGWKDPFPWSVKFKDFYRFYKKDGKIYPMGQWGTMPGIMLTKCAIVSAVRKVFGEDFGGMYSAEEMGVETSIDVDFKEIEENLNEDQINQLKKAAKSDKVEYEEDKLIGWVIGKYYDNKSINSNDITKISSAYYDYILEGIIIAKEKKEAEAIEKAKELKEKDKKDAEVKKDNENKKETPKNEVKLEDDGLPLPDKNENIAKPANKNKKDNVKNSKDNNKK